MANKDNDTALRKELQPLIDFVLEFDQETQELWMRLFEVGSKQKRTEQETEELEMLISKLKLAEAERSDDPMAKVTLVAEQVAYQQAFNKAKEAGVSPLGARIAAIAAEAKVRGELSSEAEEYIGHVFLDERSADGRGRLNSRNILEAIDEVHRAGFWPWEGMN